MTERFRPKPTTGRSAVYRPDDIDRQIVTLLLKDGRMSGAALARAVGVSERTVHYCIERLLGARVIQVGAVVDPHTIGLDVIADVFLEVSPGQVREVAERFAALQ